MAWVLVAAALAIAAFVCLYSRPDLGFTATWLNILGAILLPGLLVGLAGIALHWHSHAHKRIKIGRKADQFVAAFDDPQKFVLLLRAFNSALMVETSYTTRSVQREQVRIIKGMDAIAVPTGKTYTDREIVATHTDDVRAFVRQALTQHKLVVIDGKVDSFVIEDFPVLSIDSHWWQIFLRLARDAQLIVVLPESSPSLQYEIAHLLGGEATEKTCVLMPPSKNARDQSSRATHWQAAQAAMRLPLPSYRAQGAIFQPAVSVEAPTLQDYSADTVRRLLGQFAHQGRSLAEALLDLERDGLLTDSLAALRRAVR